MKESLFLAEQFDVAGLAVGVVAVLLERAFVEELEAECTGEMLRVPLLPHCSYTLACRGGGGGEGQGEGERDGGGGRRGKRDRGRWERGTGGGGRRGKRDRGREERGGRCYLAEQPSVQ